MTEEQKLKQAPGCGTFIMLGLIGIVILSLVGLVFPGDILPYPSEILIGVLVVAIIALVITFFMWRSRKKDMQQDEDNKAENMLRHHLDTLGQQDDEAAKLAKKYKNTSDSDEK